MVTQKQYETALERAHAEHLEITLLESEMAHVYNPKYGSGYYTVRFPAGSRVATCNCQAGQAGTFCKHRALVHEARRLQLLAQRAKVAQTDARMDEVGWLGMTPSERASWTLAHQ